MQQRTTFVIGAIFAAVGIALGAFGAHGLKGAIEQQLLDNYNTGVRYWMYGAFGLLILGTQPNQRRAPIALIIGAVLFGGSLWLMAFTGWRWLGAITPFGGVGLIVGFCLAALDAGKTKRSA